VGALTGLTLWAVTLLGDPVPLGCTGVNARARSWRRGAIGTASCTADRWSSCDQGEAETSARQALALPPRRAGVVALRRAGDPPPLWFAARPGTTLAGRKHGAQPWAAGWVRPAAPGRSPGGLGTAATRGGRRVSGDPATLDQITWCLSGPRAPGSSRR